MVSIKLLLLSFLRWLDAATNEKDQTVSPGFNFLVGLNFLNGEKVLNKYSKNIVTLAPYSLD